MKNIKLYTSPKYSEVDFVQVEEGIYKKSDMFVLSLSFEQEMEFDEGENSLNISQNPLEAILDTYEVFISDFYENLNDGSSTNCYLEFSSFSLSDLQRLKNIIGKHVYIKKSIIKNKRYEKFCIL